MPSNKSPFRPEKCRFVNGIVVIFKIEIGFRPVSQLKLIKITFTNLHFLVEIDLFSAALFLIGIFRYRISRRREIFEERGAFKGLKVELSSMTGG